MNHTNLKIVAGFLFAISLFSCSKNSDDPQVQPPPVQFQSFTLKVGEDAIAISIDNATKTIKNLPRNCDVKQMVAEAVLPTGYSISPNPATAQDYTKGVTFTITNDKGEKYTVQINAPAYDATNNPYGIYTAKQLSDVRNGLNDSYLLMNDISLPDMNAAGATATGISDYGTYGWYSIGTQYVDGGHVIFRGILDGGNHTISNLSCLYRGVSNSQPAGIDAGHAYKSNEGLFGYAATATFKNIAIQLGASGIMAVSTDGSGGYAPVGALAGRADSCTFSNCSVTGNSTIQAGQNGGGLIGRANSCTINKCSAVITHSSGNFAISSGTVGGLIGYAYGSTISNSYASCDVAGAGDMGGLIGTVNSVAIQNCYASGSVSEDPFNTSSSLTATNNMGGLVGNITAVTPLSSSIKNCYATGSVSGGNGSNILFHQSTKIGGLAGQISSATTGTITVSYCYASGNVSRVYINSTAPYFIGGLVGNTPNNIFVTGGTTSTNYWDKTTTGQTSLGGANGSLAQDNAFTANGKTTAEMKTAATYSNWDFSSVWDAASGTNNGYPYLRSVN